MVLMSLVGQGVALDSYQRLGGSLVMLWSLYPMVSVTCTRWDRDGMMWSVALSYGRWSCSGWYSMG